MLYTDTENSASEKLANLYHLDLNKGIQSSDFKKNKKNHWFKFKKWWINSLYCENFLIAEVKLLAKSNFIVFECDTNTKILHSTGRKQFLRKHLRKKLKEQYVKF